VKFVLFVDDNALLARISCEILNRHGFHAQCAYSGEEALTLMEKEPADVVITDMCMDGMNGLELAREMRARWPKVPVILVTAYDDVSSPDIVKCLPKDALFPTLLKELSALEGAVPVGVGPAK